MHFSIGSRKGYPRLVLDHASDASPPLLPRIESEGSSAATEKIDQAPVFSEVSAETLTPPPVSTEPAEKKHTAKDIGSSSIRKQLFENSAEEEEAPHPKKAKTDDDPSDE